MVYVSHLFVILTHFVYYFFIHNLSTGIDMEIENAIEQVDATMTLEGMPLTDVDRLLCRAVGAGRVTGDQIAAQVAILVNDGQSVDSYDWTAFIARVQS